MAILVPLVMTALALSGAGPSFTQPRVVWINEVGSRLFFSHPWGDSVSVGRAGVFVTSIFDVSRYWFDGSLVWRRPSGQSLDGFIEWTLGIAVGFDGVYVVGMNNGSLHAHDQVLGQAFVRKLSFGGGLVWTRELGYTPLGSWALAVSVDASGIYVTGGPDGFVSKFDDNGNALWTRHVPIKAYSIVENYSTLLSFETVIDATGISAGPKGVYVAGYSMCVPPFGPVKWAACNPSYFMSAFTSDGEERWTREFTADPNGPLGIAHNYSRQFAVYGNLGLSVGPAGIYTTGGPSFLAKYDFAGAKVWSVDTGSPTHIPFGVSSGPLGVYVLGRESSDSGTAFIQHFDANGDEVWTLEFGTSWASRAAIFAKGIFVAGEDFVAKLCASPSCIHN